MKNIDYKKSIPVKGSYDVIVCGGGVAGVAAAITAAENGFSTLLIEKSNILGGLGTLGLINYFVPMCNGRGKQIIFGLAEKWLRASAELGINNIPKEWRDGEPIRDASQFGIPKAMLVLGHCACEAPGMKVYAADMAEKYPAHSPPPKSLGGRRSPAVPTPPLPEREGQST